MMRTLLQCLLAATALVASTGKPFLSRTQPELKRRLPVVVQREVYETQAEFAQHMHHHRGGNLPDQLQYDELVDLYEDYYIHHVHDMSLSFMTGPPAPYHPYKGKGKGKGAKTSKSAKSPKTHWKGKGKGKGICKGSKSPKCKGKGHYPPPEDPTDTPTVSLAPTPTPTDPGPSVDVDGFTLTYTLSSTGPISGTMLEELRLVTETHLDEVLRSFYQDPVLFAFASVSLDRLVPPDEVDYSPTFHFLPASAIPSDAQLRNAVQGSFSGEFLDEYTESVRNLPMSNIFSSTTSVEFFFTEDVPGRTPTSTPVAATTQNVIPKNEIPLFTLPESGEDPESSSSSTGILIAASAGSFLLVVAGYLVYRRRSEETEPAGKFVDPDDHVTITGDTCTGATSMGGGSTLPGGQSVDSQSATSPHPYRSETPEWKEYHAQERMMMSEEEWEEYQDALGLHSTRSDSPFETIEEENDVALSNDGDVDPDDDSLPERLAI